MTIRNALISDTDAIFEMYDFAVAFQKTKFHKHWQGFDRNLINTEIAEQRIFKIIEDEQLACIFSITFNDVLIWGEKDQNDAIYIHRIVSHPDFKGRFYVKKIINWAKNYCQERNLPFVRMDTWGDNEKLISYYTECGFDFLGLVTLTKSEGLPKHYEGACLSTFEIRVRLIAD